jgi:hypothetical protein
VRPREDRGVQEIAVPEAKVAPSQTSSGIWAHRAQREIDERVLEEREEDVAQTGAQVLLREDHGERDDGQPDESGQLAIVRQRSIVPALLFPRQFANR